VVVIGRRYTWRGRTWELVARGEPFDRGPRRNVLLRDVETGELVVRPFRGLRRA
jgi:hypothetical protein